jgi:hypothetical protein
VAAAAVAAPRRRKGDGRLGVITQGSCFVLAVIVLTLAAPIEHLYNMPSVRKEYRHTVIRAAWYAQKAPMTDLNGSQVGLQRELDLAHGL